MDPALGREADTVDFFAELARTPYRLDFYQTLRRLECLYGHKPRWGRALRPVDEPVRLGQDPDLAFAPSALSSFEAADGAIPRLQVRLYGLFGPNGPLPMHITEYARERLRHHGDATLCRFLDIFHHRFIALFYRAWAQAQPHVNYDRPKDDRFAGYIGAFLGIAPETMRSRDTLPDLAKFFHAAEAESAYRTAVRVNPQHSDAYTNLGILLNSQKRIHEAVVCFCKVITFRPKHPEARRLLALAHCTLGEVDEAVGVFEEWLREEPNHPIALHMLAACSGRDVPSRASDGFIEQTFDSFAGSFDSKLAKLFYRAPALVAEMLAQSGIEPAKNLDVLDAGCGTGLCGPLVAPYARRLVGVDLSARMMAQAGGRGVYDELVKSELTEYLCRSPASFDVIVSADTLVYFGPLDAVAQAASDALRPGGRLIFTVEEADEEKAPAGHGISLHGRYCHTRSYVERVLRQTNLEPEIGSAQLRLEAGDPVRGLVVRGTKPADAGMNHVLSSGAAEQNAIFGRQVCNAGPRWPRGGAGRRVRNLPRERDRCFNPC